MSGVFNLLRFADAALSKLDHLSQRIDRMTQALQDLIDQLKADNAALETEIKAVPAKLAAVIADQANSGVSQDQMAQLAALHTQFGGATAELHAALAGNPPDAPPNAAPVVDPVTPPAADQTPAPAPVPAAPADANPDQAPAPAPEPTPPVTDPAAPPATA